MLREIARLRFEDPLNTPTWERIAEQVGVSARAIHEARKRKLWRRIVAEVRDKLESEALAEAYRTLVQVLRYGTSGQEKVQAARAVLQHHAALNAELKHTGEVGLKIIRIPMFSDDGDASDGDN
ncbi:MAG: hypothetical protein J7M26_04305 [Armatimonadetes bacterium]|nr:hypothetical protein [Armatimonadota bacterium]